MQARYYDPVMGRFLSVDPVGFLETGEPSKFNRYIYSNNDPINMFDPDGRDTLVISGDLEGAYGLGAGVSVGRYVQFDKHLPTIVSTIEALSTNLGNPIAAAVDAMTTVTETGTMISVKAAGGADASVGAEFTYSTGDASDFKLELSGHAAFPVIGVGGEAGIKAGVATER